MLAGALQPIAVARGVRAEAAQVSITDGPFVRAKAYLGGFWIIQVPDAVAASGRRSGQCCLSPAD